MWFSGLCLALVLPVGRATAALTQQQAEGQTKGLMTQAMRGRGVWRWCDFSVKVATPADMAQVISRLLDALPATRLDAQETVLRQLGLLPARPPLRELLKQKLPAQVGGLYDPTARTLWVMDQFPAPFRQRLGGLEKPFQKIVLLHEITHALQDCDMDLAGTGEMSDEAQAFSAWLEGEATVVGLSALSSPGVSVATALGAIPPRQMAAMAMADPGMKSLPPYLRHQLTFPYVYGAAYFLKHQAQQPPPVPVSTAAFFDDNAAPMLWPQVPAGGYATTFSLGAATFNFWFPNDTPRVLADLSGEGVWVIPAGPGRSAWVWWLRSPNTKAAARLKKRLEKVLPKKQVALKQKGNLLAVLPVQNQHRPLNWPRQWLPATGLAPDAAATPHGLLTLARHRWELLQADPMVKTLQHTRFPVLVSVAEFAATPVITHYPEPDVWLAQLSGLCPMVLAWSVTEDRFSATCQPSASQPPLRLHARLLSFRHATVMVTCTGKARQWQPGFEDLCKEVLQKAGGHPQGIQPHTLTPR